MSTASARTRRAMHSTTLFVCDNHLHVRPSMNHSLQSVMLKLPSGGTAFSPKISHCQFAWKFQWGCIGSSVILTHPRGADHMCLESFTPFSLMNNERNESVHSVIEPTMTIMTKPKWRWHQILPLWRSIAISTLDHDGSLPFANLSLLFFLMDKF